MYKQADLMFIYCETPLHAGSGSSVGVIDLPIQREQHTGFPTIAGSGLKGAVREWYEERAGDNQHEEQIAEMKKIETVFGPPNGADFAGAISITDAKILLFPVKSMKGVFAWITCPTVLARLKRDLEMVGDNTFTLDLSQLPLKADMAVVAKGSSLIVDGNKIVLDEFTFTAFELPDMGVAQWIGGKIFSKADNYWQKKIGDSLIILQDDDFTDFVKHSTEVNARIKINNDTKTVAKGALFYEENLPSETVFYSSVFAGSPHNEKPELNTAAAILNYFKQIGGQRAQIAGDATLGRGIVNINFLKGE